MMNKLLKFLLVMLGVIFIVIVVLFILIARASTFDNPVIDNQMTIEKLEGVEEFKLSIYAPFAEEGNRSLSNFQPPFDLLIFIGYPPNKLAQSITIDKFDFFATDVPIDFDQTLPINTTIRNVNSSVTSLKYGDYTLKDVPFNFGEYRFEAGGEICFSDGCSPWSASGMFTATETTSVGYRY